MVSPSSSPTRQAVPLPLPGQVQTRQATHFAVLGLVECDSAVQLGVLVSNRQRWVSFDEHWLPFDKSHRRRGECPHMRNVWPGLLTTLSACAFWTSPYGRGDRTLLGRLLLFGDMPPLQLPFIEPVTRTTFELRAALRHEAEHQRARQRAQRARAELEH